METNDFYKKLQCEENLTNLDNLIKLYETEITNYRQLENDNAKDFHDIHYIEMERRILEEDLAILKTQK